MEQVLLPRKLINDIDAIRSAGGDPWEAITLMSAYIRELTDRLLRMESAQKRGYRPIL